MQKTHRSPAYRCRREGKRTLSEACARDSTPDSYEFRTRLFEAPQTCTGTGAVAIAAGAAEIIITFALKCMTHDFRRIPPATETAGHRDTRRHCQDTALLRIQRRGHQRLQLIVKLLSE